MLSMTGRLVSAIAGATCSRRAADPTRISETGYFTVFTYKRLLVSARCVLLHGLQRDHRGLDSTVTINNTQATGKHAKLADLPVSCA